MLQFHRKGIVDVQIPGGPDQDLGEVGVDAPVAVSESSTCWLVRLGQGGSGDPSPDTHVIQLGANGPQASLDVAQTLPEGQLREGHAEKLVEAGEFSESSTCWLDLVLSPVPANSLSEVVHGNMFEQLREDGLAVVHGPSLPDRNGHRILGS
jgi:hypothetical protein